MTLEALMALGITEAQAQGALKLHNDAINGFYVPKATFEAESAQAYKLLKPRLKTETDKSTNWVLLKELQKH
jgi:pentose-5-phosphate-3-epimerase